MRLTGLDFAVIVAYLAAAIAVGSWFVRRERSTRDYFRAGGRVPWWAAGLSLYGTSLSAITYISIPALVMKTNWAYFAGMVAAIPVVPVICRFVLPFYRQLDITTAYEYLEKRFSRSVRWLGSAAFIVFHLGRTAIVLVLPALALSEAAGLSIYTSILLMGLLSVIYTMLGGIEAVIWTDVMQVTVLIGGALTATIIAVSSLDGGMGEFFRVAQANDKLALWNPGFSATSASLWVIFIGYGTSQFNSFVSDQSLVQRYLTTRDERTAGRALWLSVLGGLPVQVLFYTVGTAMFVFYQAHPDMMPETTTGDAIVPIFLIQQLPIGLAGLVIAGLFAAGMSTIDSSMNSIATTVVTDFYRPLARKDEERRRLRVARDVTLAVGIIGTAGAIVVAAMQWQLLLDAFLKWLFLVMGVLAGLFTLGIFTTRANASGAWIGAVVAVATVVVMMLTTSLNFFLFSVIGLATCVLAGYVASAPLAGPHDVTGLTIHTRSTRDAAPAGDGDARR